MELKHSSAYPPTRHGYNLDSTCERCASLVPGSEPGSVTSTNAHYSPRAALPSEGVTLRGTASMRCLSQRYLTFVVRTGSCARPKPSCRLWLSLVRQVFAGCDEPLLGDGPSRRYLCDLCIGAWIRTPPRPLGASVRCFPSGIGLSLGSRRSARENFHKTASLWGFDFGAAIIRSYSGSHTCVAL